MRRTYRLRYEFSVALRALVVFHAQMSILVVDQCLFGFHFQATDAAGVRLYIRMDFLVNRKVAFDLESFEQKSFFKKNLKKMQLRKAYNLTLPTFSTNIAGKFKIAGVRCFVLNESNF